MLYTFANDGNKEALLKRCYRRFQVVLGVGITALTVLCLLIPAYMGSHAWVVLPFLGYFIGFALWDRSRRRRDGIQNSEWQAYLWRQPMMIVVWVIMAISVIVHLYQVIFPK